MLTGRRALLLEDDVALRDLLLEALSGEGFEVRTCSSFHEVRDAAANGEADYLQRLTMLTQLRDPRQNPEWTFVDREYEIWMTKIE